MAKIKKEAFPVSNIKIIEMGKYSSEELIKIYRETNNSDVLNVIVERFEKLAYSAAKEFKNGTIEYEDLLQLAFTGLLVAINRFNTGKENKFSTFAFYCIKGEILHHLRDCGLIKYPRWIWKLNKLINDFIVKFEEKNNRYPTKEEISLGANISLDGIDEILKVREAAFYKLSFDGDKNQKNSADNNGTYNRNLIKSRDYRSFELVLEDRILLWDAIDKLTGLNKKILISNYFLGYSQTEIGEKIGISQKSVSRHLNSAISELKEHMTNKTK